MTVLMYLFLYLAKTGVLGVLCPCVIYQTEHGHMALPC